MDNNLKWKPDWPACQDRLIRWWEGKGFALCMEVKREQPWENVDDIATPADLESFWTNPDYRCGHAEYQMAQLDFHAEAFPYFDTQIGPGSLGLFLGAHAQYDRETVWYEPCITDPEPDFHIRFDPLNNAWLHTHECLIDEGLIRAKGRYLVGMPDLIEGLDTLAALRGDARLLYDLADRPGWVLNRLEEVTTAWFSAFDFLYQKIRDERGGNAFSAFRIWGPGKTAKIQCDISANLSPRMFRKFAQPFLSAQCEWLDYSLYHLDGTNALQQVDPLLEIERLNAIEWTPQAGKPGGGDPSWYDLYRRIRAGGKSIQVVGVRPDEVIPLVDAVGSSGLFVLLDAPVMPATARQLHAALERRIH